MVCVVFLTSKETPDWREGGKIQQAPTPQLKSVKSQSQHTHTKCLLKPLESEDERVATSVSSVQRALQPAQSRGCVVNRLSTSPSQPLRVTVLYTDAARASQKVRERRRRGGDLEPPSDCATSRLGGHLGGLGT